MNNSHNNRNAAIIRQHQNGKRLRDIARDFRISRGRVQQIVKNADRDAARVTKALQLLLILLVLLTSYGFCRVLAASVNTEKSVPIRPDEVQAGC